MLGKDCKIAETVQLTPSADLSTLKVSMRLPPVSASYGNISAKSFSYNIRLLRIDPLKHGRLREHVTVYELTGLPTDLYLWV